MSYLGKILVATGVVLVIIGTLLWLSQKIPILGRLPGDFVIRGKGFSIFVPVATMILLSIILTVILNFIIRK
ncbi:DUF2905 domain-containing protein [bacterium]|nr:MAG: DUF2905 domain-containing protein [bacterium]